MTQDATVASLATDSPSGWHSIRPWDAQLSLYVREITSVSATFILATDLTGEIELDTSLATLGFNAAAQNDSATNKDDEGEGQSPGSKVADEPTTSTTNKKTQALITETLSKGLRVNVNDVNWQRVLIRVDEKADEAIIIVYGLMPGRQYDIDLALVQPGQGQQQIRRQVLTFEDHSDFDTTSESTDPESPSYDHSNSSSSDAHQTISTPSTSPSRTIPNTPPPPPSNIVLSSSDSTGSSSSSTDSSSPPQISLEERLNQLHHSLSLINTERESLLTSLKSARKEAQKADAALRSEMEALKRASEKHSAGDVRAKQKILALQESVKRAQAATKETEAQVESIESEVPELLKQKEAKEAEYGKVKEEADKARKARETEMDKDRKRQDSMRTELQSLTNKLEKLTGKKEKHENSTIPELESQLNAVEKEIEEQERLLLQMDMNREFDDASRIFLASMGQQQQSTSGIASNSFNLSPQYFSNFSDHANYIPVQRPRHQSLGTAQSTSSVSTSNTAAMGPGPIGRPAPVAPIQRPSFPSSASSSASLDLSSTSNSSSSMFPQYQQLLSSSASSGIWSPPIRNPSTSTHSGRSSSLHYPPPSSMNTTYRDPVSSFHLQQLHPSHLAQQQQQQQQISPPSILANPTRSGSLKSKAAPSTQATGAASSGPSVHPSTSVSSSTSSAALNPLLGGNPTAISSTLSGRAPVFEPGKGRSFGLRISTAPQSSSNSGGSSSATTATSGSATAKPSPATGGSGGGGGYVIGGGGGSRGLEFIGMGRW